MFVLDYGDLVYIHASLSILKSLDLIHYTAIFFISQFHVSLCSVSENRTEQHWLLYFITTKLSRLSAT